MRINICIVEEKNDEEMMKIFFRLVRSDKGLIGLRFQLRFPNKMTNIRHLGKIVLDVCQASQQNDGKFFFTSKF